MNLTIAPNFGKQRTPSVRRVSRVLAATFFLVLLTSGSALAGPVRINQVAQTVSNLQGTSDIQITLISQHPVSTATVGPRNDGSSSIGTSDPKLDALLGFPILVDNKIGIDIDVIEEGEVEGTICDCGEILIVGGGGFPMWPLAFLAAVPVVFIDFDDECVNCEQSTPTPTPTPQNTPTPTPEPASLLIFGTGLVAVGAGLRRRYNKAKLSKQNQTEEEL